MYVTRKKLKGGDMVKHQRMFVVTGKGCHTLRYINSCGSYDMDNADLQFDWLAQKQDF